MFESAIYLLGALLVLALFLYIIKLAVKYLQGPEFVVQILGLIFLLVWVGLLLKEFNMVPQRLWSR